MNQLSHDDRASVRLRQNMVETQLIARGIRNQFVIDAMLAIPRERFIVQGLLKNAYDDRALPIENDQTISQPFIVAYMTELLELTPQSRVLEIGTGSGYQTAVLARLSKWVYTVERLDPLGQRAKKCLDELGIGNYSLHIGDGTLGLPKYAPFDRVLITAASPDVPSSLLDQLADPGIMVIPVGSSSHQQIIKVVRHRSQTSQETHIDCRFVKLLGKQGWPLSTE